MINYEQDFYGWTQEQTALLMKRQLNALITIDSLKHFSALGGYFAYAAIKRYAR